MSESQVLEYKSFYCIYIQAARNRDHQANSLDAAAEKDGEEAQKSSIPQAARQEIRSYLLYWRRKVQFVDV
jgi:hypothetical protein